MIMKDRLDLIFLNEKKKISSTEKISQSYL